MSGYLDDNILVNYGSTGIAIKKGAFSAEVFQKLGFTINIPKSVIDVVKIIEHLGFIINSIRMIVTMTTEKVGNIFDLIGQALTSEMNTIRHVARVIGKITATGPVNRYAALFTKNLEVEKNQALFQNRFDYNETMILSNQAREDLAWLARNLERSSAPIRCPKPDYVINTDASNEGWGCFDPQTGIKSVGRWSLEEQEKHINTCTWVESNMAG